VIFERAALFHDNIFEGPALFSMAEFHDECRFIGTNFKSTVTFDRSTVHGFTMFGPVCFEQDASFQEAKFQSQAIFSPNVVFRGHARFGGHYGNVFHDARGKILYQAAIFADGVNFGGAVFESWAGFDGVRCRGTANFFLCRFQADVSFEDVVIDGPVLSFHRASFVQTQKEWSVSSSEYVVLDAASFTQTLTLKVDTKALTCSRANFLGGAVVRVNGAVVVIEGSHFEKTSLFTAGESDNTSAGRSQLISLRRTNVENLALNLDLRRCRFQDAHRLDKLRIEGCDLFAVSPRGWTIRHPWPPSLRWTRRQVLAEECDWRYQRQKRPEWRILPEDGLVREFTALDPEQIANIYRALRKGREDNRDVAGSSDFYYGEMEMRRQSRSSSSSWGERAVLFLYWLTSGYGTRVLRPLTLLFATIFSFAALLHSWGFARPVSFPRSLVYAAAYAVSLSYENKLDLTALGEALQIGLRLLGPLFLGLILLSIRGRVTR
jgi:Pentapeptide repeats (9 copies)